MRRLALAFLLLAGPAAGQVVSEGPTRAAVTIYRDANLNAAIAHDGDDGGQRELGLAFITETRAVDLPAGRSRIAFRGVADSMVPETAAVEGLPGATIERAEDYNLLSAGSLLEASVGRPVRLLRTDPKTGVVTERTAVVRAGPDFPVLEVDGRIEGLRCSGAPERLVFDRLPPNLSDKPTFSMLADVPKAGRYTVRLSYLATGFTWSANYVARLAPDGRSLDLIGWLTLVNRTSASFADAPTDVVAGELSRDDGTRPPAVEVKTVRVSCWPVSRTKFKEVAYSPAAAPPMLARAADAAVIEELVVTSQKLAVQSDLGDYKLYTLPEPTTVAARQTKQVMFLSQAKVAVERLYGYRFDLNAYDGDPQPRPANVFLRLKNEARAGLGKPLPSGVVSVSEPGPGEAPVLAGQQAIRDTPVGLPLEVELGRAMDVMVTVRLADDRSLRGSGRVDVEVGFVNDKPAPVQLEYRQAPRGRDFRVGRASAPAGTNSGDSLWTVRLAPGERKTLSYSLTWRD